MAEYITKKQVIEWFSCYGHDDKQIRFEDLSFDIQHMIPEDVAPVVHGRWISWEQAGDFIPSPDRHECSVCHDAAQVLVNGIELLSPYCPNCGAKMDLDA